MFILELHQTGSVTYRVGIDHFLQWDIEPFGSRFILDRPIHYGMADVNSLGAKFAGK